MNSVASPTFKREFQNQFKLVNFIFSCGLLWVAMFSTFKDSVKRRLKRFTMIIKKRNQTIYDTNKTDHSPCDIFIELFATWTSAAFSFRRIEMCIIGNKLYSFMRDKTQPSTTSTGQWSFNSHCIYTTFSAHHIFKTKQNRQITRDWGNTNGVQHFKISRWQFFNTWLLSIRT